MAVEVAAAGPIIHIICGASSGGGNGCVRQPTQAIRSSQVHSLFFGGVVVVKCGR